jgi:hypothetical protein
MARPPRTSSRSESSVLFVCRAVDSVQLTDGTACLPGDTFGLWGKPGMRAIVSLFGVPTWMLWTSEKATGKANPMRVYTVKHKPAAARPVPIIADHRKTSRGVVVAWLAAADAPEPKAPASDTNGDVEPWA